MAKSWFIKSGKKIHGPISSTQLKGLADQGKLHDGLEVSNSKEGPWHPIKHLQGLKLKSTAVTPIKQQQRVRVAEPVAERLQETPATIVQAAPMRPVKLPCPFCGEEIMSSAVKCRYCNEFLDGRPREPLQVAPQPVAHAAPIPQQPNVNVVVTQNVNVGGRQWSAIVAMLLSLLIPGLGQLYKGQPINGVVWFLLVAVGYVAFIFPGVVLHICCVLGAGLGNPYR